MPRKAYQADLRSASDSVSLDGISNVRAGDDDGEFRVKISPEDGNPFELSALISDLGDYPTDHVYQIFVTDDNAPAFVGAALEHLPNTQGRKINELLHIFSRTFVSKDPTGDSLMIDSQVERVNEDDSDDDDDFGAISSGDEAFDLDGNARMSVQEMWPSTSPYSKSINTEFKDRIRADLNITKSAGLKLGVIGGILDGMSCYVSVSCRVAKLGISEAALEAWKLRGSEYLILIIHYPNGYKSFEEIERGDSAAARRNIEFRVGCADRYKPSLQEAILAFSQHASSTSAAEINSQQGFKPEGKGFRENFISKPLNQLFNDGFPTIVRYRKSGMSWTGAEKFFNEHQGKSISSGIVDDNVTFFTADDSTSKVLPDIVTADHLRESAEPHSLPLVALQFMLRHFVRCTEFCLVCHCRVDVDLEAIKPYVCDKPLCLYQYMSLGFGPSIEHEITSQPYVVDLLLSFCYSQAGGGRLKEFPVGLSLSVPEFISTNNGTVDTATLEQIESHKCDYNPELGDLLFDKGSDNPFSVGDWIMLMVGDAKKMRIIHCRIKETVYFPHIRLDPPVVAPIVPVVAPVPQLATSKAPVKDPEDDGVSKMNPLGLTPCRVIYLPYNKNFDLLTTQDKTVAIARTIELIPPVMDLKKYLLSHSDSVLVKLSDKLSPAALGVLRWVIASNRACIMEPPNIGQKCDYRVHGMKDWMQFRFDMGAPDKERRFIDAVQATALRKKLVYPTLYAWHGSPLQNWHSIIREGLHFKNTDHGRAYGHGVYHSLDFSTSSGYSHYHQGVNTGGWPNSVLKISTAMALNEIVNAPDEFVNRTPHLVVAQLDWIQTRFLFVRVTSDMCSFQDEENTAATFITQDPNFVPRGQFAQLKIPTSATRGGRQNKEVVEVPKLVVKPPPTRRHGSKSFFSHRRPSSTEPTPFQQPTYQMNEAEGHESDLTDDEDRQILVDEPEQSGVVDISLAQQSSGGALSGLKSFFTRDASPKKSQTDFVPGELKHSTLPLIKAPEFATLTATRRLQKDFQSLVRLQQIALKDGTMHELGWWVDAELFENMYQWIVELHSFDIKLPLATQLKQRGLKSVVMEMRFPPDYPMSPPFIRVIRPRFMAFMAGGGGHITAGGSLCMELLTNSGWSAVSSIESILLQVHMAMSSTEPRPAQLDPRFGSEYSVHEAVEAYIRVCNAHGWKVPDNFRQLAWQ